MKIALLFFSSLVLILVSCRKDSFITSPDARVVLTADTLKFDTVFTSVGSVTRSFKIINENNQKLRLSGIRLMGGAGSAYNMNVDGEPATEVSGLEIGANDSIYVFVSVNIDPAAPDLPFIVADSIQVTYNGRERFVQLQAFGQNAHFLRDEEVFGNQVWANDLPYVILGYLRINEGAELSIQAGCRLYFHADAPMVVDGSLKVNGLSDSASRVYFRGDRLDEPYRDYPGAWPGIYFTASSSDNEINYAVISNAYMALNLEGLPGTMAPKLSLNESIIDQAFEAGISAVNSSISARNCLISNSGKNLQIFLGGEYDFQHCTIVSYPTRYLSHLSPVIHISNSDGPASAPLEARFQNCIIWGESGGLENEVVAERSGSDLYDLLFDHVLWKQASPPASATVVSAITDQAPLFVYAEPGSLVFNFRLQTGSPGLDAGTASAVNLDLDGKNRPVGPPDLGSYEQ